MRKGDPELTYWSREIAGALSNHNQPVRFDVTGGHLGITQGRDRVLLTPQQVKAMRAFLADPAKESR